MYTRTLFVLLSFLHFQTCKTECSRATFEGITINLRAKKPEFQQKRITGCITPHTIPTGILHLTCYNQTIPTFYESAIERLPNVTNIHFAQNKIKRMKTHAITNLSKLFALFLSDNSINVIEKDAFLNLPNIMLVDLSYNKLTFLDFELFGNLPSLRALNLSHNEIDAFEPEWFGKKQNSALAFLSMDHNYIRTLPRRAFANFKSLGVVDLSSNHIRSIHREAFQELNSLNDLYLGDNRIQLFEEDVFKDLIRLNYLHFYGNNLTFISDKTLSDISKVQGVSVHANPWQCGCYNKMIAWSRTRKIRIMMEVDECYDRELPWCVVPLEEETWCLEERFEDLNSVYFERVVLNETCRRNSGTKIK